MMMSDTQRLRESLQPMIRDELMRSWREGMQAGLKSAHDMAEAVRNEAAAHCTNAVTDCGRAECEAQIAVLSGLMSAFLAAAKQIGDPDD
jgi:hypothetical protein